MNEAVGKASSQIETAYFQTLIKEWLINIMSLIKLILRMIGFAIVHYVKRFGTAKLFFTSVSLYEVLKTVRVILNNSFSPFIMSLKSFCLGIYLTAKTDILQQEFSPNQRAIMQSIIEVVTADQHVDAHTSNTWTGVLGGRAGMAFITGKATLAPELKLAATYDLHRGNGSSSVHLANGSSYVVEGEALKRFGIETGAKIGITIDNMDLSLSYEGRFKKDYQDYTGMINFRYNF